MTSQVLVTGADGLLGSYLVRELLEAGYGVRALIQAESPATTLDGLDIDRHIGDLTSDRDLEKAVSGCRHVFHCAAIASIWADPGLLWRINVDCTRRLLDLCLAEKIGRLVFVGSASSFQFGPRQQPGDETGGFPEAHRGNAYMESKHEATRLVREYVEHRGLDAVIVVPTFMLGYFDSRPSSGELVRQFVNRPLPFTPGGGRNFVHARDVARAMVTALREGRCGETYIAAGENLSYKDFFSRVARLAGSRAPRFVLPEAVVLAGGAAGSLVGKLRRKPPALSLDVARLSCLDAYYSNRKAKRELGLESTPIDTAIADSIRGLRAYGHLQ